jgi:hypothetical protein
MAILTESMNQKLRSRVDEDHTGVDSYEIDI